MATNYLDPPRRRLTIALRTDDDTRGVIRRAVCDHGIDVVREQAQADVHVADLRPESGSPEFSLTGRINEARRRAASHPLILLYDKDQSSDPALVLAAATDVVVPFTTDAGALVRAVRTVCRLIDRSSEAGIRLAAMGALGVGTASSTIAPSGTSSIIAGDPGPRFKAVFETMQHQLPVNAVLTKQHCLQMLELGQAQSLVIPIQGDRQTPSALLRLIRRHSELHTLPVAVVERAVTRRQISYWAQCGADIVVDDAGLALAANALQRAVRARALSDSLDAALALNNYTSLGESTRIASGRYFDTNLFTRTRSDGPPHTLGALRVYPQTGARPETALSEVAVYLALANRSIDLMTRPMPDLFLFSFAATDENHAVRTLRNFERLVEDLKFGPKESACTFRAASACVAVETDDAPEHLLAQLLRRLPSGLTARQHALPA
jgi:hypothetical protein